MGHGRGIAELRHVVWDAADEWEGEGQWLLPGVRWSGRGAGTSRNVLPLLFSHAADWLLSILSRLVLSTQPFPYGTGAGYIFSNSVNAWLSTDTQVIKWVRDAAGATREELQWQKFEDTSTGYWLTYSPFTIEYMNVRAPRRLKKLWRLFVVRFGWF